MNSFDVFDTLIARRFLDSTPIFHELAALYRVADFVERRRAADAGGRDLAGIYEAMGLPDYMREKEIALECQHAVPIRANLDRVSDGDLLISDMYIPGPDILRILRTAGLERQVTIHQSSAGKSSGAVWRALGAERPALHLGDNRHSDVAVPKSLGFACELYAGAGFTETEATIAGQGLFTLACLIREVRLRANPMVFVPFFEIACQYNLPLLFVMAEILKRRHAAPLVFLGRDTQLLSQIFGAYVRPCHYLPFSRRVAFAQPEMAVAYLRSQTPRDAVLVDLSSTGATWERLGQGLRIEAVIYSDMLHYTEARPALPPGFSFVFRNSECGQTNQLIEVMNCGDHGHLSTLGMLGGMIPQARFAPHELEPAMVAAIHAPAREAVALQAIYRPLLARELGALGEDALSGLFAALSRAVCAADMLRGALDGYFRREAAYKTAFMAALASRGRPETVADRAEGTGSHAILAASS